MKIPAAALAALLLVAICSLAEARLSTTPITCCFSYMQRPILRSLIKFAYMTSSQCATPAVILVTKKGREVCADPNASWVQAYLKYFSTLEN
ncbi:C-C motif chemokine 3 [Chlamydotis macqueenii]|uniref:C-C motif chemokine 3 n=1 Tax=Chlamydotis macqueenii TaxID=187382 RepID=A0A091L6P8_9AVES|nr:PREDICTED: C-C motif chemokine 3-like [Chlamydotis macqueenii]KFP38621.1 C-C motif chemokine 3 [Chlamydotis macqueenii]